jgi:glycosyltransferase involved in cell wall biosynthesis
VDELGLEGGEAGALREELGRLRLAAFEGLHEGGTTPRRRALTRLLEREELSVLYVVHGFPPETWAGTEVYTLNLAREMTRRGHRCTILARSPGGAEGDGGADFEVVEGELEGLRVLRMTNRLSHRRLADSYRDERADEAFRRVLEELRPDLVHFQHLIHLSAGLPRVARAAGIPTIVHCHDYWALCARVQLIRPDGVRCEENMGLGCLWCVKERSLDSIPAKRRLGERFGGLLDLGARLLATRALGPRLAESAGAWLDMRERGTFVPSAFAACDLQVSPSRFLRERLLASGVFDPHAFVYSDNGMRMDHVAALEKVPDPEGRIRFGFVGSLVWYKGGRVLVEALAALRDRPVALSVFGDFRPDEDAHHAELAEIAPPNVRFRGRFDNARLSEVYAEIDVLVVPSTWFENSPITIHEAFMTKTPVVASDIGGMAEYVRDGVDGLLFPAGDAAALARTLARFVDEPGLLGELSRDFMTIKTIEEDAALTEARYRALVARVPAAGGAP